jgi:hypothetical protein
MSEVRPMRAAVARTSTAAARSATALSRRAPTGQAPGISSDDWGVDWGPPDASPGRRENTRLMEHRQARNADLPRRLRETGVVARGVAA